MSGYTFNGVAGRIRDVETKIGGNWYVSVCWLAMARNSGKAAKKLLETKVFGQGKPTSTFRNAWRIADKSFAEGFHAGHRVAVAELGLDEAIEFAMNALEAHKTALGVTNMADYEAVCKFATRGEFPPTSGESTASEPEAANKPSSEPAERNPMDTAIIAMMSLSAVELLEFAAKVQGRLTELDQAEQLPLAA